MLYLISKPFDLMAGNYSCKQVDKVSATATIKAALGAGELRSLVHFASTVAALKPIVSIDLELSGSSDLPRLSHGDRLVAIRLRIGTPKGRTILLDDLEFWQIDYSQQGYDNIKESSEWPAVLR